MSSLNIFLLQPCGHPDVEILITDECWYCRREVNEYIGVPDYIRSIADLLEAYRNLGQTLQTRIGEGILASFIDEDQPAE